MRSLLLVLTTWVVAGGLLAQGPHLDVAQSGEGLRVSNPGALSVSGDTEIELMSTEMVFPHAHLLIGALRGDSSVWIDLEPTFLEGRCRGSLSVVADGRNLPRLEYGPFEVARPAPPVKVAVLNEEDGWRRVVATVQPDGRAWSLRGEFPSAVELAADGLACGEAELEGKACGFTPETPMEASWRVRGGPGRFELHLEASDGCRHTVEGVLQGG